MKLTVIIPAYNAEDTVKNAIESVLSSFAGQEVLIIDDGSKDATGEICDQYARDYPNIAVVHTENGGVSQARNIGIEKATGDYIMFMDADDRIVYDGSLDLDAYLQECDMVLFSFDEKKMDGKLLKSFIFDEKGVKKEEVADAFLGNKYSFYGPWAKIFRRDIILRAGLRYNVGQPYGEDVVFVLNYLSCISKGIRLSASILYSHYINPNGASCYRNYYSEMNQYLLRQAKAFEALVVATRGKDKKMIDDFACSLFNEALMHYYQRIGKTEFFQKYSETYQMFIPYLAVTYLRNYSLFGFLKDEDNTVLTDQGMIRNIYKKNWWHKAKHEVKKIISGII